MGNILEVDKSERILETPLPTLLNQVDPSTTLSEQLVSYLYTSISRSSVGEPQKSIDEIISKAFEDKPDQCNHMSKEKWVENLRKELTELYTSGLSNSHSLKKDLQETRFDKNFRVMELGKENAQSYYETQFRKFCILYSYIKPFMQEDKKEKEEFCDALAKVLEQSAKKSGANISSSKVYLGLIFSLANSQKAKDPQLLEDFMRSMYSTMIDEKGGDFKPQSFEFYEREKVLTKHRNYLIGLIKDEQTTQLVKDLALKLIIVIGNMRASGEDYLVVYNLIKSYNLTVDISSELIHNEFLQNLATGESSHLKLSIDHRGAMEVGLWMITKKQPVVAHQTCFSFDREYIYIYNQKTGLHKYGKANTPIIKAGKNYGSYDELFKDGESTILALNGVLYVRDPTKAGAPFTVIDPRKLEPVQSEELSQKFSKCARDKSSSWNDHVLEVTDSDALNVAIASSKEESYRKLINTPLFTDGEHIYVLSFYLMNPDAEEKEYEPEVEVYDSNTWKFIRSKRLSFIPQKSKSVSDEETKRIASDTQVLREYFHPDKVNHHTLATNGRQLAVVIDDTMYFFDLETGHRLLEKVKVPKETHGYDHHTNSFWYYTEDTKDIILKNYKIQGFSSGGDESGRLNLREAQVSRIREILEKNDRKTSTEESEYKSYVKSLLGPDDDVIDITEESKHNQSAASSLFMLMYTLNRGCEEISKTINDFDSLNPHTQKQARLDRQIDLFRSRYGITITTKFLAELTAVLSSFREFLDEDMTEENILEQYQFLSTIKLIHKLILCLKRTNLLLSDVI